ncbi:hypothetical protein A4A49_05475 [Nicotiana attenuata]|uniref:Uncharacterized protein n=1 Tax=Nicotiana attenuata TaxID=49451 RepID=A0A1J6JL94_NICAT|nr:hypothetical protein A4A49_05475 [Nicotiana attenuata]
MNCVGDKEDIMARYRWASSPQIALSHVLVPVHDNIVPTAEIQPQSPIHLFRIGGKMLLPAADQELYDYYVPTAGNNSEPL